MPAEATDTRLQSKLPAITLAGKDEPALGPGLLSLRVEERLDGLYACEATFGNWGPVGQGTDFLYFDRRTFDFGKALQIKLDTDTIFDGKITALEARFPEGAPPSLTVLAEDRLQDLRMTRRTRTFADTSDADVARSVASDHSLTPDVDVSGPTHKVLAQLNLSDLAFLRERARAIDAEVWIADGKLTYRAHARRNGAKFKLAYGNGLRDLVLSADLAHQRTEMSVSGWDVAQKKALKEKADASVLSSELGDGDAGPTILKTAFGARSETVAHSVPLTSDEARARVEAIFRTTGRRFVSGRGVAETDARLRVGALVTLEGLGPLFSGEFSVTEVVHRFDRARGLRSEFAVQRPGLGKPR
jgi:uncharacterized protein